MSAKIQMVTDNDCDKCAKVKKRVASLLNNNGIDAEVVEHNWESEEAVSLALTYDLKEVPSLVVNGVAFGYDFDAGEFIHAAKN